MARNPLHSHNSNLLPSIRREKLRFQNKMKTSAQEKLDLFSLLSDSLFLSYTLCYIYLTFSTFEQAYIFWKLYIKSVPKWHQGQSSHENQTELELSSSCPHIWKPWGGLPQQEDGDCFRLLELLHFVSMETQETGLPGWPHQFLLSLSCSSKSNIGPRFSDGQGQLRPSEGNVAELEENRV